MFSLLLACGTAAPPPEPAAPMPATTTASPGMAKVAADAKIEDGAEITVCTRQLPVFTAGAFDCSHAVQISHTRNGHPTSTSVWEAAKGTDLDLTRPVNIESFHDGTVPDEKGAGGSSVAGPDSSASYTRGIVRTETGSQVMFLSQRPGGGGLTVKGPATLVKKGKVDVCVRGLTEEGGEPAHFVCGLPHFGMEGEGGLGIPGRMLAQTAGFADLDAARTQVLSFGVGANPDDVEGEHVPLEGGSHYVDKVFEMSDGRARLHLTGPPKPPRK